MYLAHQELAVDSLRQKFIDKRCGSGTSHCEGNWVEGFSPRESVEAVRNCTQLARGLADSVTKRVAFKLLETTSEVHCVSCDKASPPFDKYCTEDQVCGRDEECPQQDGSPSVPVGGSREECVMDMSQDGDIRHAAAALVDPHALDMEHGSSGGEQQWNVGGEGRELGRWGSSYARRGEANDAVDCVWYAEFVCVLSMVCVCVYANLYNLVN